MKTYDYAVFDLDGTLLDTLDDLMASVNYALYRRGFKERSYEEIKAFVGNGIKNLVERSVPEGTDEKDFELCLADFKEHYSANSLVKTAPFDGIIELLDKLKAEGVPVAVVSNKIDSQVKHLCREVFGSRVQFAVGQTDGIRKKPYPDLVQLAFNCIKPIKEKTVYIGDSDVDIQTARNSGLDFIGAAWGFRGREFLLRKGAETVVDSPAELEAFFNL